MLVDHLQKPQQGTSNEYGEHPKILNTEWIDKMAHANIADPDQTAPEGAVWSGFTLFAIPLCILRKNYKKKQNLG